MLQLVLEIWPTYLKKARVGVSDFLIAVLSIITRILVIVDVCAV